MHEACSNLDYASNYSEHWEIQCSISSSFIRAASIICLLVALFEKCDVWNATHRGSQFSIVYGSSNEGDLYRMLPSITMSCSDPVSIRTLCCAQDSF